MRAYLHSVIQFTDQSDSKSLGLPAGKGPHFPSIVKQILCFGSVLALYCFLSFVFSDVIRDPVLTEGTESFRWFGPEVFIVQAFEFPEAVLSIFIQFCKRKTALVNFS